MKLRLLIARHAEAVPSRSSPTDADRPLTERGREEARILGHALVVLDWQPRKILVSPLVRSRETAERIREAIRNEGGESELVECPELEPGATPPAYLKVVERCQSEPPILMVGHQPDAGRFISFLISGGSMELQFTLQPASIAVVEIDRVPMESPGSLTALLTPGILSKL